MPRGNPPQSPRPAPRRLPPRALPRRRRRPAPRLCRSHRRGLRTQPQRGGEQSPGSRKPDPCRWRRCP
eukprot:7982174-Lingulodinium_polyedra.AAC.1